MSKRTITVPGVGRVLGQPDTVVTRLGVNVTAPSVAAATSAAAAASAAMATALRAAGVDDRDLRTAAYSVAPQYRYPSEGGPVLDGFQVSSTMSVRLRDVSAAGATIDAAVAAGGDVSVVDGISFEVADPAAALIAARSAAFDDAMDRATQLATAARGRVGRVISVAEASDGRLPIGGFAAAGAKMAFAATPVQPGEVALEVHLELVVEFDPGAQDTD